MNHLEAVLVSAVIADKAVYLENKDRITDDLFLTNTNARQLFQAFTRSLTEGRRFDMAYAATQTGISFQDITELWMAATPDFHPENVIEALAQERDKLRLSAFAASLMADIDRHTPYEQIIKTITDFVNTGQHASDKVIHISQVYQDLIEHIQRNLTGSQLTGVPTGIDWFDHFSGGLHRSDLIVMAGRTSQGKTSLALTMTYNAAVAFGKAVGFVSLEMSNLQLAARLSAYASAVSSKRSLFCRLTDEEQMLLQANSDKILTAKVFMTESHSSRTADVLNQIRLMKLTHDIDLAIIDYLQLMSVGERNRSVEQDTADTTRRCKNLAKELDIPVILISQLSRQGHGESPKPTLGQLRNSGQIEEAADVVMFVYRPEFYGIESYVHNGDSIDMAGKALVEIAKGRNIGTGSTILDFNSELTYFTTPGYIERQARITKNPSYDIPNRQPYADTD